MFDPKIIYDQLKGLSEIVYKSKSVIDRIEANWDLDRKDFSEFEARIGHLEVEVKSLKEMIQKLPQRINDKIEEVTDPITQEVSDFKDVITEKKIVAIDKHEAKKKKTGWLHVF